jgi:hypothetical protein
VLFINFFEKQSLNESWKYRKRKKQHDFKRNRSTSTLSAELLSLIAIALDDEEYVIVASIDLSSAFNLVNVSLLLKRLQIISLPNDLVDLIIVWLK